VYVESKRGIKASRIAAMCSTRGRGDIMRMVRESLRSHRSATASHCIADYVDAAAIANSPFHRHMRCDYTAATAKGAELRLCAARGKSFPRGGGPARTAPCTTDSTAALETGHSARARFALLQCQGRKYTEDGILSVGHAVVGAAAVCFPPYTRT
jgi:hypothetical protein